MRDHALFARGLPRTPELATDTEISGLYRILESSTPARGDAAGAPPADGETTSGCVAVSPELGAAFGRYARAAAAVLNR